LNKLKINLIRLKNKKTTFFGEKKVFPLLFPLPLLIKIPHPFPNNAKKKEREKEILILLKKKHKTSTITTTNPKLMFHVLFFLIVPFFIGSIQTTLCVFFF
jgi:hypothetical protein